jgi:hypothetical protein
MSVYWLQARQNKEPAAHKIKYSATSPESESIHHVATRRFIKKPTFRAGGNAPKPRSIYFSGNEVTAPSRLDQ